MKIRLGNMPAKSSAIVRIFCQQKLEIEDQSYCFRLPMAFIPPYMGNASKALMEDLSLVEATDPDKYTSLQEFIEMSEMPVQTRSSGLYDFKIQVLGEGKLTRLASLNHPVHVKLAPEGKYAQVSLKDCVDRSLVPSRDFVLYVRDEGISSMSVISSQTLSG